MKILGLFRGFPGLGRVVAGVSLMETLKSQFGFKIKAISYLQGNSYLRNKGFETFNDVSDKDICSIGLLPTNHFAESIFSIIKEFRPSVILVDGEPLIVKSLRLSFPYIKIVTLLNPSDVVNEKNNKEAMEFLNDCYRNSDLAIVHGSRQINGYHGYKKLLTIPTIIRPEILDIIRNPQKKIYCILGGGTLNVGSEFVETTLKIAKLCIDAAAFLPDYTFNIICSSDNIYSQLHGKELTKNTILIKDIIDAEKYYKEAELIVTRSGRNTLGEAAALGIPTLSFICGCEYRKHEQEANIRALQNDLIRCVNIDINVEDFISLIKKQTCIKCTYKSHTGNEQALDAILQLYRENADIIYHKSSDWIKKFERAKELSDANEKKISLRKLRADIFKENIDIVSKDYFINESGKKIFLNKKNSYSELYENEIKLESPKVRFNTEINICNEDSIDCGIRLQGLGYNPIVLNMACADGPGGGVIGGCYGQEESLFRRTNLYEYMYRYAKYAVVYGLEKSSKQYPLDSAYKGVYVHDACVFRKKEKEGYQLLDRIFNLSFVAVPALDTPSLVNGKLNESDKITTKNKIRTILRIAIVNHHNAAVLGAFGCGIFKNPPTEMAHLFRLILNEDEFKGRFEIVNFAILEDKCSQLNSSRGNYITFKNEFHD